MKIYLVLLTACVPLGYFTWKAIDKTTHDTEIAFQGSNEGREAQKQLKSAWDQAQRISKMDDAVFAGALGLGELPGAPAVPPDAETKLLYDNFEAHAKAVAASKAFVSAFPAGNVPDPAIMKAAPNGAELSSVLGNRKKVIPLETGIKESMKSGDIGPGSQLAQALPGYAKLELADLALVAQAWPLVNGEWPPPGLSLHGSRLVLILKTSDLVEDSEARVNISRIFNGLDAAARDSLVTGKFVLVTNRDQARVQQWPAPDAIGPSNDVFVRGDYKIAFEAAMEVATKLKQRISGQPEIKVHLIWRSDADVLPRGSGGVIRGMGSLDVELQWIALSATPERGVLMDWFHRRVNPYDWRSEYQIDLDRSLAK